MLLLVAYVLVAQRLAGRTEGMAGELLLLSLVGPVGWVIVARSVLHGGATSVPDPDSAAALRADERLLLLITGLLSFCIVIVLNAAMPDTVPAGHQADAPLTVNAVARGLILVVAAPLVEEPFFRGALHDALRRVFRGNAAVVLAGASWFAAFHAAPRVPQAFVVGGFTCLLRARGVTLRWCVLFHAIVNLAAVIGP